ncbi:hypothetical protein [Qipengyuania marisflavi]|uniref:DUF1579 domain-containing protein n=1 Tax=Qipengyuania marisflavi TaxID=2486356 RepID=A0A5S3Q121_9SPHN|nr:hypothetical protein [Qipengyuania marisflavi]TMM50047.1 hypothetical protein FEV51_02295 [Qipengyuania marisflavi]
MLYAAIALMLAQSATAAAQAAAPPPRPPQCDSAAHAAFDFWVGEWDVYPASGDTPVAASRIERLYNGCAVRENWMPLKGTGGGSLNSLDPDTGRWHQTWIGSAPGRVEFVGGPTGAGRMVLTGYWDNVNGPGQDALVRMSYTLQDDGSVRQHGEASTDHGLSWQTSFDLIYRPKGSTAP